MATFNPTLEPLYTLFRFWLRFVLWGLRIAPICLVIALPAVALFDRFSPWPAAIDALSAYPDQTRICIGFGGEGHSTAAGYSSSVQRAFVLVPRALTLPIVVFVTSTDGAAPTIEQSRFAFWFAAILYIIAAVVVVRQFQAYRATRHA